MKQGYGSAPGKIILTGEHSVVYGYPALAVSLNLRCTVISEMLSEKKLILHSRDLNEDAEYTIDELNNLSSGNVSGKKFDNIALAAFTIRNIANSEEGVKLEISSTIPVSAGLGSSAAVVVATIGSLLDLYSVNLPKEKISEIAFESEKITHGKPSGIDNSIATFGGILKFESGEITTKTLIHSIPILIGNTNVPRNTKTLVEGVAKLKSEFPDIMEPIFKTIGSLVNQFENALNNHDISKLGKLMKINQGLLDSIGVGHSSLSEMIWQVLETGAVGAKLTGAGGGGCMIALTENAESQTKICEELGNKGFEFIPAKLSSTGVVIGFE